MDATTLVSVVSLVLALSIASERIVEIVKGLVPFLTKESPDLRKESWRRAALQILAVGSGVLTATLARPAMPVNMLPATADTTAVVALGLLASGGSGFWNAVLTYFLRIKDIKEEELGALRAVTKSDQLARL